MLIPISHTDPIAKAISNSAGAVRHGYGQHPNNVAMLSDSREAIRQSQEAMRRADRLLSKSTRSQRPPAPGRQNRRAGAQLLAR